MEANEYLAFLTLGAVAPYVAAALVAWIRRPSRPKADARTDAGAPSWYHFPRLHTRH